MRYFLRVFGCRVNQAEASELGGRLAAAGWAQVRTLVEAELIVVRTCSVTRDADREALKFLRRAGRDNPGARLVVGGCLASRSPGEILRAAPQARVADGDLGDALGLPPAAAAAPGRARALLKVQDGCDGSCAYCIVPRVRPRLDSLAPEAAEERVRRLAAAGAPEIVLCGIRLGRYRHGTTGLSGLLERLLVVPGAFRLRLSSLEITEADDCLAGLIAGSGGRLCPHLHLPLQSGCEATLRRMRRPYTAQAFARRVGSLSRQIPGLAVFTDVITGFPGETEAGHRESLGLVQSLGLRGLHVFRYSAREGTPAAAFPDPVPADVVRQRLAGWLELDASLRRAHARDAAGQERVGVPLRSGTEAVTEDFLTVRLDRRLQAGLWRVRVAAAEGDALRAQILGPCDLLEKPL